MQETKNILMSSAMRYGFALGVYWVVKYLFFILGNILPFITFIYWGMSLCVPYIAYVLTKRYRADLGGKISFFHGWQFGVLIYFFAAIIVSLLHFVYYRYIADPNMLSNALKQTVQTLYEAGVSGEVLDTMKKINLTPIHMALQGIVNNTLYGIFLSVPVAMICRKEE